MIGTTLLHYRILRKLGQGGMGEVYLAEDTRLERQVALKVLPAAVRRDPERIARFKTEAKAAAQLNHPHIATIYAVEEVEDLLFITMEYVDGQPLSALLPPDGLPLAQFFAWFVPLADALCHAHEHRVTHRDLKPGNLMVSKEGVPKILDFGLAQITRPEPVEPGVVDHDAPTEKVPPRPLPLTQLGAVLGTPAYMSPEQAERKPTDARTEVFSFGVVLYEALTGQRP
ncbi:MAG: serine/threonine protein kinase, partial [Candidatus Latescibacteria bacterium]|nr:serine/threonine protein kinase [Candidatus Latescibacterota bacterium]